MNLRFYLLLSLLLGTKHAVLAGCGSASCPLNSYRFLGQGSLQVGFSYEYINQDQVYVGSTKAFVGAIPGHHNEVQTINSRTVLQLQYGILDRLSLGFDVPFIHREHSHIQHDPGQDVWESWDFSGLGDVSLSSQIGVVLPSSEFGPHLSIVAGVKLPTGIARARNGGGEEAEVTLQPGSGSTDGIVGVSYRQALISVPTVSGEFSALPLIVGMTYQMNGSGTHGWRFGNSLVASLGTAYQFTPRMNLLLQCNGRFQEFADVGTTDEPRENTGGTWLFASPGMSVQLTDRFSAYSYVQVPFYQNVHGIQQTARFNLQFGISANVNILE